MKLSMQELWNRYSSDINAEGFVKPNKSIKVWGVNPDTKEIMKSKVERLLRQRCNKILKITLSNDKSIRTDELHQFVLFDDLNATISAKDLKVGDKVPIVNDDNTIGYSEIKEILECDSKDNYVYDVELEENHLFLTTSGIITHNCCRLRNDSNKMKEFFNSLGSGGIKIGSHRVCSLNLGRIAHNSSDLDDFISKLKYKMALARDILKVHRELLEYEIEQGLLPLYTLGFMDLKTQYSTVGLVGIYEALDILGYDIVDDKNMKVIKQVVNVMNEENDRFSEEDGVLYNLEAIPGESACVKLAQKDQLVYGMKYFLYSNQFIPLVKNVPLSKRIKLQGLLDNSMSGGSILHINIAEKITSVEMLLTLMNYCVESGVVYWAVNYAFSVCKQRHINVGKHNKCQVCGSEIDYQMTRVVGFFTKVSDWIKERRGKIDFESRVFY